MGHRMSEERRRVNCRWAAVIAAWLHLTASAAAQETATPPAAADSPAALSGSLHDIAACLAKGQDAALYPDDVKCLERYMVGRRPKPPSIDCGRPPPNDRRVLRGNAIKQLAAQVQPELKAEPAGIRIFGAAFCSDELDLIGLKLPYSLTLSQSYFHYGIAAANFRTDG